MSATAVPSYDARVDIAFTTGPDSATPAWEDMTSRVRLNLGINVTRGRQDQFSTVQPSTMSLTLENPTGEFTAGNVSSAHYPNVLLNRRIRYSIRLNTAGGAQIPGNLLTANQSSFETSVAAWSPGGSVSPTLAQSTLHSQDGTKSMLVTWGTGGSFPQASTNITGLVIGRSYTVSAYVFVPTGTSPFVKLQIGGVGGGTANTTRNVIQRISVTWTATANTHSLQLWPTTSPISGDTVFIDAVMCDEGSSVGTFTLSAPPIYYRFDGCVNQWPTTFDAVGLWSEAGITATDRTKRQIKLRDIIGCEYVLDGPSAYYPLGEAAGAASAGNTATNAQPVLTPTQVGSGGTLTFGSSTGPGTDGLTALSLVPVNVTNGLYLNTATQLQTRVYTWGATSLGVEAFCLTSSANTMTVVRAEDGYSSYVQIGFAAGKAVATVWDALQQLAVATVTSAASFNDGLTHHLAVTQSISAGTVTTTLYVDGTSVGTGTYSSNVVIGVAFLRVGGSPTGALFTGTIAHVALGSGLSAGRVASHSLAGSTGFAGERSDQRIARIASYAGFATGDVVTETGLSLVSAQQTGDQTPIDLMRAIEATENGLLFIRGDGDLIFQSRSHRYNQTPVFDLGADTYDPGIAASYDEFGVANDVTASRPGGATVRRTNAASQSATPPGLGQVYTVALSLLLTTDSEVADAADWRILTSGSPTPRYPTIPVDLMTQQSLQASMMALELGDQFTMSSLPSQAAASTATLNVEGWSEVCSTTGWDMNLNASTAYTGGVWQLDSATHSQLDSTTRMAY